MGLLVGIFLVAVLGLIVGLINPQAVLSWLPETKRNRSFVSMIFGGVIVVSFVGMIFPSTLDTLLMTLFFVSIFMLIIGLIKPDFVLKKAPESKRTRLYVLMIFGITALVCVSFASSLPTVEEGVDSSARAEQTQEEVDTAKAKEEAEAKAKEEEEAKAKEEAEAKAKAEEEAKAKEEAEAKAKAEEEAKAKAEAEAKAAEEAKAKAEAEAKAKAEAEAKITKAQENCKRSAVEYLEIAAFSKQGLIEQLVFEGYSEADATSVVNNLNVDWSSQAYYCAVEYDNLFPMSRQEMIEQLSYEGFTNEEAIYAVDNLGL